MAQLNPRQRAFVYALFDSDIPPSGSNGLIYENIYAARRAGYGNENTKQATLSVTACRLRRMPKIQAAEQEVKLQYVYTLGPAALRALRRGVDNPDSRDHARFVSMALERVVPATSTSVLKIEQEVKLSPEQAAEVHKRIEQLAARFAVPLPAPKPIEVEVIEAEVVDVSP
jgi:hypothetical protein